MQYTINQLYNIFYEKVNTIYSTFQGFFGEDYVDLQKDKSEEAIKHDIQAYLMGNKVIKTEDNKYDIDIDTLDKVRGFLEDYKCYIYVWWPFVKVTNENGKSIDIKDLYAKITVQVDGRIPYENVGFTLNRASYTASQFYSNYLHSHIQSIPKFNFTHFSEPCLGTGPIKGTITTLKIEYNEVSWMLFCQELAMYVTVESLKGVPYRRLESVGAQTAALAYSDYSFHTIFQYTRSALCRDILTPTLLKRFIKYYLKQGNLSLGYRNGKYTFGMSYYEYMIDVSNTFIDFFNLKLSKEGAKVSDYFNNAALRRVLTANGKFYVYEDSSRSFENIEQFQNEYVLTFKGKDIKTTITEDDLQEGRHSVILLNQSAAMYILYTILTIINYRYNYEYNKNTSASTASTGSSVIYL